MQIGSRTSSNYYRVYQKTKEIAKTVSYETVNGLEFELEMKKQVVKSVQQFLFDNQIEEFEDRLTQHFYTQSSKNFVFNFCYTD